VLGSVYDLVLGVGFESRSHESELEAKSSSISGGRGTSGTFRLRKRLTTMTGNMTSDLIPEMGAEEEENKIESNTEMKA